MEDSKVQKETRTNFTGSFYFAGDQVVSQPMKMKRTGEK
jgi:hypothetical protein